MNPSHIEIQEDGRIRKWKMIKEEDKFLRVIMLEDGETVHNASLIEILKDNDHESEIFP